MLLRLPLLPLQRALIARLTGDLPGVGVFAYVPDATDYPFITVHDFTVNDESPKGAGVANCTYTIGIASRQEGVAELQQLIDKVLRSLMREVFTLEDNWEDFMGSRLEFVEASPQVGEGEVIQTAELRFRFRIQDKQATE